MDYVNQEHKEFVDSLHQTIASRISSSAQCEGNVYWHDFDQLKNNECVDGAWPGYKEKRELIFRLASQVNEVLEIGLNAGHSASIWLFANPNIKVRAIDIEYRPYTYECAKLLRQKFKDRFEYYSGDSRDVFPRLNNEFKNCDLIHIDGGHDFSIFKADFENALTLEHNCNRRLLLIDDAEFPGIHPTVQEYLNDEKIKIFNLDNFDYKEFHLVVEKNEQQ